MKDTRINCPQELVPELISYLKRLERKGIRSIYLGRHVEPADSGGDRTDPIHAEHQPTREHADTVKTSATTKAAAKTEAAAAKAKPPATAAEKTTAAAKTDAAATRSAAARTEAPAAKTKKPAGPAAKTQPTGDVDQKLAELEKIVVTCTDCALHEGRTNGVFGTGSSSTRVMFIGEGPGAEEDKQGKPFVGRSGQLLTKMIEAIDLTRDEVYIANIVKCRPPNNRDPLEEEVRCCEKYLIQQIQLIKPRVICALGRVSAHWLLQTDDSLAAMRRADNRYQDTPVLVTYHPAALLRNPNFKRAAWEDFKKLRDMIAD